MPPEWSRLLEGSALLVVAHPDDEVIGAGSLLPFFANLHIVHVTDGSPRNLGDAHAAGCATREEYARVRRHELSRALELAGIGPDRALDLGIADQEAAQHIPEIAARLRAMFEEFGTEAVLTHAYEGGHPDHDAVACAVHAARPPAIFEFPLYHGRENRMITGEFLPGGPEEIEIPLKEPERRLKRRMVECFTTQLHMLKNFSLGVERFRRAPEYDFTRPPHPGTLYYEHFDWGVNGEQFRQLAKKAYEAARP